jgi:dipeptidase
MIHDKHTKYSGIDINDGDNYMASANIFDVARRANLWNPEIDGAFDFQGVYGLRVSIYHEEYIARRWWRVLSLAAPSAPLRGNMTTTELPFSIKVCYGCCTALVRFHPKCLTSLHPVCVLIYVINNNRLINY